MKLSKMLFSIASFALIPQAQATTQTYLTPSGFGLCEFAPYMPMCITVGDPSTWSWLVTITSDSGTDVVAFNLDVVTVDGITHSFLIRRGTDNPSYTEGTAKLGNVRVLSYTTTDLKVGATATVVRAQ